MPDFVVVSDIGDVKAVIAAYQRAMNIVLNPEKVRCVMEKLFTEHSYQSIHPNERQPAVGSVGVFFDSRIPQGDGLLFVRIFGPDYLNRGVKLVCIPKDIPGLLEVSPRGTSVQSRFTYDKRNRWYEARLIAPLKQFVDHPYGSITLR